MATKFKAVTIKPKDGGRLAPSISAEEAGVTNYVTKRDWRRLLDREIRGEGYDKFRPDLSAAQGSQHLPDGANGDDINLVTMARRPNGTKVIIVGTKEKLYRYVGDEDAGVYASGVFESGVFEEITGDWYQIGSGFSSSGKRWEVKQVGNYLTFNNEVDLPVTYDFLSEMVIPIYELRDQGIAKVDHIDSNSDLLVAASISQIREEQIDSVISPVNFDVGNKYVISRRYFNYSGILGAPAKLRIGGNTASDDGSTGNYIVADRAFFSAPDVGRVLAFRNGLQVKITGYTSSTVVTFTGTATVISPFQSFYINDAVFGPTEPYIFGSFDRLALAFEYTTAGEANASMTDGILTADSALFASSGSGAGAIGIRWEDGTISAFTKIDSYTASAHFFGGDDRPLQKVILIGTQTATNVFEADHVGQTLIWQNGVARKIVEYVSGSQVKLSSPIDFYWPQESEPPIDLGSGASSLAPLSYFQSFFITNPDAYAEVEDEAKYEKVSYRVAWSAAESPRQWAASADCAITAGSHMLRTERPVLWLEGGNSVVVLGAGVNGASLIAKVLSVLNGGTLFYLDTAASTTVGYGDGLIQNLEQVGNLVGFDDLLDDGSAIVAIKSLREALIVYKETSIIVGEYQAVAGAAYNFRRAIQTDMTPWYKHAVVTVDGLYHLYPGSTNFYRFDLVNRQPVEVEQFRLAESLFYQQADLSDPYEVFAVDNAVANEIWFCYPGLNGDYAMRFDYRFGTLSTTSIEANAGAVVVNPITGDDWFVFANADKLYRYGLVAAPEKAGTGTQSTTTVTAPGGPFLPRHVGWTLKWADGTHVAITGYTSATAVTVDTSATKTSQGFTLIPAIWHRDGSNYDSILESGLEGWGNQFSEKRMNQYVLLPSGKSPDFSATLQLYGVRNAAETPTELFSYSMTSVKTENMVPTHEIANYFRDKLTVSGKNNPAEISARIFSVTGVDSRSFNRQVTD